MSTINTKESGVSDGGGASDPVVNRTRNWLIALLFFGTIINYIDRQVLSLLKPTISAEYGWGDAEFAHFASASQLAAAAALLFVGWIIDRFGVRLAYGAAVAMWSVAGIAHAFRAGRDSIRQRARGAGRI